ncbi:MAG: hypothetical protein II909_04295 [Kiritimatiellae bacterium]|nr:hypothetical protein [Kiritimatiellia bacterium]
MPEIVEKLTRIGNTAVHLAQEENMRKGIPNVYCINGKIIWQLPGGSITDVNPFGETKPEMEGTSIIH